MEKQIQEAAGQGAGLTALKQVVGFTPGPWHFGKHGDTLRVWCRGSVGTTGVADICIRRSMSDRGPSAEETANANLIAAAPEMFALLKTARAMKAPTQDWLDAACKIIRQVEG